MKDHEILTLLHKPMKYLSDIFSKSIKNNVNSNGDLYNDLVVLYYEKKNKPKAKLVAKLTEKDLSFYWYIVFKNYLLDKYRRSVNERLILEKVEASSYERFTEQLFVKKDFIL